MANEYDPYGGQGEHKESKARQLFRRFLPGVARLLLGEEPGEPLIPHGTGRMGPQEGKVMKQLDEEEAAADLSDFYQAAQDGKVSGTKDFADDE